MGAVLAIDQGTSQTKAAVVDPERGILAVAEVPVRPVHRSGGRVEQDPIELLDSVKAAGYLAATDAGARIDMVALANQGEAVLAWDPRTGDPLSTVLLRPDRRALPICTALADHAERVAAISGLRLEPCFGAPKMVWLREHVTTGGVVSTTDSWLIHRLTGEFVTDAATASRWLLLDLGKVTWSAELAALFGLEDERLPRLLGCDEVVGTTRAFGAELPVGGLIPRRQAALLANGCLLPGQSWAGYGSGASLVANTGVRPAAPGRGLTASVAWQARGQTPYCLEGEVHNAGSALDWLARLNLVDDPTDPEALPAEDDGVLFVPALSGLGVPWRPGATAAFVGMRLSTRPGHLARAVIQGVAAQLAELARELPVRPEALRVDGAPAASPVLMQIQADLLQLPLEVSASPHATVLGTAAYGLLAAHPELTLADVVPQWRPERRYEPQWPAERAEEYLARWRRAVETTPDAWE